MEIRADPNTLAERLVGTLPGINAPLSPDEAIALQEELAARVEREDRLGPVRTVCGVDVHYVASKSLAVGAAVVMRLPQLEVVEQSVAERPITFAYVPGLLSFRELPAALAAVQSLSVAPDVVLCDGQGIAHPRRCGLASQLGLLSDRPSIGVAKTRLLGEHAELPGQRGAWTPLVDRGEQVGAMLRTRAGVRPLYISTGHRVSVATAIDLVLACSPRYRVPEPLRAADHLARISA